MQDQRMVLLEQQERLLADLAATRTRLNMLTPVASLPTELLEMIFSFCISWLYESKVSPMHQLAWSQVCRSWRAVSVSSARTWSCIDLSRANLANEFLARSKGSPLSIVSSRPLRSTSFLAGSLRCHSQRVQTVDVHLFPEGIQKVFETLGDMPNLVKLSLQIPSVSSPYALESIPSLPSVREISLNGLSIPWDACEGLMRLEMRNLPTSVSPSLPLIFERSPNLEVLVLENVEPRGETDVPVSAPASLRTIHVSAKPNVVMDVFSSLASIPREAQISCPPYSFEDLYFIPLARRSEWSNLRLARHKLTFFSDSDPDGETTMSISSTRIAKLAHTIPEPLASSIKSLEFSSNVMCDVPHMGILLANFLNLERIAVVGNVPPDMVAPLVQALSDSNVCPNLKVRMTAEGG